MEGIKLCEINAYKTFIEVEKLISQKSFRQAYFFGILSLEETGKAGFLLENMDRPCITKEEWRNRETFMSHVAKIAKAKNVLEQDVIDSFHNQFPRFQEVEFGILGWSEEELKQLWENRNRILFVNYNFDKSEWESPQDISDLEQQAMEVIAKAHSAFLALESQLVSVNIAPELKRIK